MFDSRVAQFEKSLETRLAGKKPGPTAPDKLDLALFFVAKWGLVGTVTALYLLCHEWHPLFGLLMAFFFAYSFAGLAQMVVDFVVYFCTDPVILPERTGSPATSSGSKSVFIRPVCASSVSEMELVFRNMRLDIGVRADALPNMKFVLLDNSRNEEVLDYTRQEIASLHKEYGASSVFYFHRNPHCDFFKKAGIFQDFLLLLQEGRAKPGHYTDAKWEPWTKGTRNPSLPVWDEILGDVAALGLRASREQILEGREEAVPQDDRIEVAFLADADNQWPRGQAEKIVAKMLHPDNLGITIFQPSIELIDPSENWFMRLNAWARQMYGFDPVAKWRLYRFSPFYGKGAIRLSSYLRDVIKTEVLHPGRAASHDFQESLHTSSVLVEDVYLLEKSFSNKLSEFVRGAQWLWGDMETVAQYLCKPFDAGRKEHLWMLLRVAVGPLIYGLWLLGSILAWTAGCVENSFLLWALFLGVATVNILLPRLAVPYLHRFKKTGYTAPEEVRTSLKPLAAQPSLSLIAAALAETALSVLIHSLDLVYRSKDLLQNLTHQIRNREFTWVTRQMSEMRPADSSIKVIYRTLLPSTLIGTAFLLLTLASGRPSLSLFLLPYTVSFLAGPFAIWYTAKPLGQEGGTRYGKSD